MRTLTRAGTPTRPTRRERRAERVRLARLDTLSARLAEIDSIDALLARAAGVVERGWVQNAWFAVADQRGPRAVAGPDVRLAAERPVAGACLVGSVVEAGGGVEAVRSQEVQRTLDLLWHALREDADRSVRWCPGPQVRMIHVLELTYWNDAPDRTRDEVVALLRAARGTADRERARTLAERDTLVG